MKKLAFLLSLTFFSSFPLCGRDANDSCIEESSCIEWIDISLPTDASEWFQSVDQIRDDGRRFKIWIKNRGTNQEERIILITSPFMQGEPKSISQAIETLLSPIKKSPNVQWTIFEQSKSEAIIGWREEEENLTLTRVIITPFAFHSISYVYHGPTCASANNDEWISYLKSATIQKNCP